VISVIIPTYNRCYELTSRALPSVLAQTVTDWEAHIVGDGTDGDTCEAMAAWCRKDSRLRFTNLPHANYSEDKWERWATVGLTALNHGLGTAKGDWIAVLGDDDEWTPDHHAVLLNAALCTGADHVYGVSIAPSGQRWGAWPPGDGQLANGANLYRASLGYRYDLRCIDRGRTGDADLWLRMVADGVSFAMVEHVVHHYYPSGRQL
jgi:glycosyltransferase involved in cell wall biosynthesis